MSVAKDELYRLIEALPDKETPVVKRFLEFVLIRSKTEDQAWLEAELSELPPISIICFYLVKSPALLDFHFL